MLTVADPLPPADISSRRPRLTTPRAILLGLVAVIVGGLVGAAGFAAERRLGGPHVDVQRTSAGWRITAEGGLRFRGPDLHGRHLVWQDGPFVLLMDLDSGRLRTLAPGPENGATWRPAVSGEYVVWFEAPRGAWRGDAYVYDFASGRRRLVAEDVLVASYPDASGPTAVWTASVGDGATQLTAIDLASGEQRSLAVPGGEPLVDGRLVASRRQPSASGRDEVVGLDLDTGEQTLIASAAPGSALGITGWAVSGRRIAWCWKDWSTGESRVLVRDVDTLQATPVATGAGLVGPSLDGDLVVWAEPTNGGARIMGLRLGGESREVAATKLTVSHVLVSGGVVAWMGEDAAGRSVLEVTESPL